MSPQLDPSSASPIQLYHQLIRCIVPRPIAWVSTISEGGVTNLAPFSFFTGVGINPPTLCFCPMNRRDGTPKDTLLNLGAVPEFVVNVVPADQAEAMNLSAADLDRETSEFEASGIEASPAAKVRPPRVRCSPVHLECEVHSILNLGVGPLGSNLVIGKILHIEIAETVLDDDGLIDPGKLDLIGRMGGDAYVTTRERFSMKRPG
jgi:flavin reductase (DIM6/NTAB) family NADH-FMN oxidoreductase RutF